MINVFNFSQLHFFFVNLIIFFYFFLVRLFILDEHITRVNQRHRAIWLIFRILKMTRTCGRIQTK